jgi:hypothetical protein
LPKATATMVLSSMPPATRCRARKKVSPSSAPATSYLAASRTTANSTSSCMAPTSSARSPWWSAPSSSH